MSFLISPGEDFFLNNSSPFAGLDPYVRSGRVTLSIYPFIFPFPIMGFFFSCVPVGLPSAVSFQVKLCVPACFAT